MMESMQSSADVDPELLKEDREQMASIYNNLYLSCISSNDKEKGKEYLSKNMHYNRLLHGENSIQVANALYIMSNLNLKLGLIDEAVSNMSHAVKVFDNQDEELLKAKDDMLLIQARFFYQFSTIYYIKGDYAKAKIYVDKAHEICGNEKNYTYETLEAFRKILVDVTSVQLKCEAKLKGVSSYSLRLQKEREESEKNPPVPGSVAIAQPNLMIPTLGMFGLFSAAGFALSY